MWLLSLLLAPLVLLQSLLRLLWKPLLWLLILTTPLLVIVAVSPGARRLVNNVYYQASRSLALMWDRMPF